ncbi:cytochrome c oxidase subunit 2A [Brevibacillus borstelensis]
MDNTKKTQPEQNLKGTFVAVLLVGAIILLSWFGVFGLFLGRA